MLRNIIDNGTLNFNGQNWSVRQFNAIYVIATTTKNGLQPYNFGIPVYFFELLKCQIPLPSNTMFELSQHATPKVKKWLIITAAVLEHITFDFAATLIDNR